MNNFVKYSIALAIIAILGFAIFAYFQNSPQPESGTKETKELPNLGKIPNLVFRDYEGNPVNISKFSGKIVIVNSWAVWCPFCREELPDFAKLKDEFQDDIVILAVNRQESIEKAKTFTDSLGVADKILFLMDPEDSFYRAINGLGMPETIFADAAGNVRIQKHGFMTLDEMRSNVQKLYR